MILDEIVTHKKACLAEQKRAVPLSDIRARLEEVGAPRGFGRALSAADGVAVIAEIKKASPSRGLIRRGFDPAAIAKAYEANGASAISVLTDERFFGGCAGYLRLVKEVVCLPVLRKDFIIDEYQVYESRAIGADAILLIATILGGDELGRLLELAGSLGMDSLVEVHTEAELDAALAAGAHIIGINNRDLRTFETNLAVTFRLAPKVPEDKLLVSESGITCHEDILSLAARRVRAVLIGEALMREQDVGVKLREFLGVGRGDGYVD